MASLVRQAIDDAVEEVRSKHSAALRAGEASAPVDAWFVNPLRLGPALQRDKDRALLAPSGIRAAATGAIDGRNDRSVARSAALQFASRGVNPVRHRK